MRRCPFLPVREVSRGGMGVVFLAEDDAGQRVALKRARQGREEAAALARIPPHPGIVRLLDAGEDEDGPYLALEWLEGETLAQRLARGPLPTDALAALAERLADALAAVHDAGLIHRDLKPENIWLDGGAVPSPKLLDFGLAQPSGEAVGGAPAAIVGTPRYMSPEQARSGTPLGPPSDVFSLGAVLFECATGRPAFGGEHVLAVLSQVLFEPPPPLLGHDGLSALITRMLAKRPEDRPADGRAVVVALQREGGPASAPPVVSTGERLLQVVLVTRGAEGRKGLAAVVRGFRGTWDVLADGTGLALFEACGSPREQAVAAARCALALEQWLPGRALAVGFHRHATRAALESFAQLLDGEPGTWLDEGASALLEDAAVVQGGRLLAWRGAVEPGLLLGRPSPFLGREREWERLRVVVEEGVLDDLPSAWLVVGERGSGKSRLRRELAAWLAAEHPDVEVWLARAEPHARRVPFSYLGAALRHLLGEAEEPLSERLVRWIAGRFPPEEHALAQAVLGDLLGVPLVADQDETLLAQDDPTLLGEQFESLLAGLGGRRHRRLVVLADDLQWADRSSIRVFRSWQRAGAATVLAFSRETSHEAEEPARARQDTLWVGASVLHLRPLDRRASLALLRAALPELEPAAELQLVDTAAGNPLFLEELLRAAASGQSAQTASVLGLIEARLRGLRPPLRRLLRAASVFGRHFWMSAVSTLLGEPESAVAPLVSELITLELIQVRQPSRFHGTAELAFRGSTIEEVAYQTLPPDERTAAHARAAAWLVAHGERDAAHVAEHYERARLPGVAADWWLKAAQLALEDRAFGTAVTLVERGLPHQPPETRATALLTLAEACRWTGDFGRAERAATEALPHLARQTHAEALAREIAVAASARRGDYALTLQATAELLEGAVPEQQVALGAALVRLLPHAGEHALARRLLEHLERSVGPAAPPRVLAELARARGAQARHRGELEEDLASYEAAWRHYAAAGDQANALNAQVSYAFGLLEGGLFDQAVETLRDAQLRAEHRGLESVVTRAKQNLALALLRGGAPREAHNLLEEVLVETRRHANPLFEAWSLVYDSLAWLELGEAARAFEAASRAQELGLGSDAARAGAAAAGALALVKLGQRDDARAWADDAHSLLEQSGSLEEFEPLVLRAWLATAREGEQSLRSEVVRRRLAARAAAIRGERLRALFLARPDHQQLLGLPRFT